MTSFNERLREAMLQDSVAAENARLKDALAAQPEHKHTEAEVQALLDAGEKLATMRYSDGEFEQYVRRILGVPKP